MRIVHFGTYSVGEGYPRNAMVESGLRLAGAEVFECRRTVWRGPGDKARGVTSFIAALAALIRYAIAWAGLARQYLFDTPPHDVVIVGYSGHLDVFLAKAMGMLKKKPLVLDAFLSLYEAVIEDRKLAAPSSIRARLLKFIDRESSRIADLVLLDTNEHMNYYRDFLGVPPGKLARVFVGGEEEFFHPQPRKRENGPTEVLFFGSFLPLHGVDTIVRAIKLLEAEKGLHFTLIGDGPEWEGCRQMAGGLNENLVTWEKRWLHYDELRSIIADSDICLGIFGAGPKASRVIPCKVFNVMAMGMPLITSDTPAAREGLVDGESARLVPPGDPGALAKAIIEFKNDVALRKRIAEGALITYRERFSAKAIGRELLDLLESRFQNPDAKIK